MRLVGSTWRDLVAVCATVVVAHAPGWLLGRSLYLVGPLFDVDILVALAICCFSLPVGIGLLLIAWAVQLLIGMSLTFHFTSVAQFISSLRLVQELQLAAIVSPVHAALFLCYVAAVAGIVAILRRWKPRISIVVLPLAVLTLLDVANGSGLRVGNGATGLVSANISGSPAYNMASAVQQVRRRQREPLVAIDDSVSRFVAEWAVREQGDVLLVVVESLGDVKNRLVSAWLRQQLVDQEIESRWHLRWGSTGFRGSTTAGELRVLCGLGGDYSALDSAAAVHCLPNQLATLGYRSIGLHGFSARMFQRKEWWPLLGLDSELFLEDLPPQTPRCGGVFRGACDGDLLKLAAGQFGSGRTLVYVLTLNAHLPVEHQTVASDLRQVCAAAQVSDVVCALTSLHGELLRDIGRTIRTLERHPLVVIVGDHSPPFWRRTDREQFSQTSVPLVLLVPRAPAG